jgi:hypothetical protein
VEDGFIGRGCWDEIVGRRCSCCAAPAVASTNDTDDRATLKRDARSGRMQRRGALAREFTQANHFAAWSGEIHAHAHVQ